MYVPVKRRIRAFPVGRIIKKNGLHEAVLWLNRQSSGLARHDCKENDVFLLFLLNNVKNHFLCSINVKNKLLR